MLDFFELVWMETESPTSRESQKDIAYTCVLHIRRRRWLTPDGRCVVQNIYPLVAEGTRYSVAFAEFLKKNLDTTPVTARCLGKYYFTDGNNLERSYKDSLSGFREWGQLGHAKNWVLLPDNMGERLGINETSLHDDLFTFLTNKVCFFRNL